MRKLLVVAVLGVSGCSAASSEPKSNSGSPDTIPVVDGRRDSFSPATYAAHIRALRKRLHRAHLDELNIRIEDPFVVIGDGTMAQLTRSSSTVRWAADKLEQDFFSNRPAKIVDIYLFTSARSYNAGVRALTGETPDTPYGFYSPSNGAMFMNIATGGGTLVHEIVHPYVEADFPDAPPWLNEGLGSLFEQSAEREGRIVGLTNWRLAGLQQSIRKRRVQSFWQLTSLDTSEFYGDDTGTNYAQSRYLLYYLQEKGKLRAFYHQFRRTAPADPSGYKTLVATLGVRDMKRFKQRWERYVTDLEFP